MTSSVDTLSETARTRLSRLHLRAVEPARFATIRQIERHRTRGDHLERLRTFAATRPVRPVFSHWSAVVIHGLPMLGRLPSTIHLLARGRADRADRGIVQHARRGDDPVVEVRGLLVTSVARTVADLASKASLMDGVTAADHALSSGPFAQRLPRAGRPAIIAAAGSLSDGEGRRRALAVASFADGRAESPLESVSRVSIALAGAPPPDVQVEVEDLLGFRARLDFVWPTLGLVGEADGAAKYQDPAQLRGKTAGETREARRQREHLIRSMGLRVIRWGWVTGTRPIGWQRSSETRECRCRVRAASPESPTRR